ncbi:diguanylate phosphodiesterase [Desulfuromonas acetoxidans DSM 684]|uniref:Diguanylate phosphodiesterase n=2 Tax=Desulfuromonas acetoxidans TaxID=891 RepID=Q1JWN3_DESA6|nr:diguanylate phosphodiesterase [Desulfuromonas acetoxidans DSM 684]
MNCPRCHSIPRISQNNGNMIISCAVKELAEKMVEFLNRHQLAFQREDSRTLYVKIVNFKTIIDQLCHEHFTSAVQREGITVLFLDNGEKLTAEKIKYIKTLQQYYDLIKAQKLISLIDNHALTTYFQPIVDIPNNSIYGYETLCRGVDDDNSLISPSLLFEWARQADMLFYLDRECREMSLKTAAVKNIRAKVFINFIPTAIYDPHHCLQSTVKWANQLEFDPKNIIFEVTESERVEDIDHLKDILDYYKSQGFMIALDDIGSGYSSLNMVAKLQPDVIKVDRELIKDIHENSMNQSVFCAINQIAKDNGTLVLAEGVEKSEELRFCAEHGADLAQGYYFGRPNGEPLRKL